MTQPSERDLAGGRVGAMLCGWTIERALGVGPVCASFLGVRGGEQAVLRVLREPFAGDPKARSEWLRASWAANRFHHGRVVKVLDQGTDERGAPVIMRAWARGTPLHEAVASGMIDVTAAMRLTEQLLDALEMAHAHGILHGALTPSNVVVTARGTVRVLDFATTPGLLARRSGASEALLGARTGPFVAPERRTSPVGPATELSDVWGVGACLQFALAGMTGIGEEVSAVVALAVAPDPASRYESAYAMLGDVRRVLAGKRPRLDGTLSPVPSSRALLPVSSSGIQGLRDTDAPSMPSPPPATGQWRGNALLVLAIAALVGFAMFVLMRERLADAPRGPVESHAVESR